MSPLLLSLCTCTLFVAFLLRRFLHAPMQTLGLWALHLVSMGLLWLGLALASTASAPTPPLSTEMDGIRAEAAIAVGHRGTVYGCIRRVSPASTYQCDAYDVHVGRIRLWCTTDGCIAADAP